MDVKSTFLNEVLEKEIYVEQPDGFITPRQEHKIYLMTIEIKIHNKV